MACCSAGMLGAKVWWGALMGVVAGGSGRGWLMTLPFARPGRAWTARGREFLDAVPYPRPGARFPGGGERRRGKHDGRVRFDRVGGGGKRGWARRVVLPHREGLPAPPQVVIGADDLAGGHDLGGDVG